MVNATANVIYKQPLFKTDYGGHTKAYLKNVAICGSAVGDPTNQFVANQCVGASKGDACNTPNTSFDVIADNMYYSTAFNKSALVCPPANRTAGDDIEMGSEYLSMPTTEGVIALAKAALGMPAGK
jgi:hypothetical protein